MMIKKWLYISIAVMLFVSTAGTAFAAEKKPNEQIKTEANLAPEAKSAILMDYDTGTIIYEKDAHKKLPPASITKIMTMLLIMEALDQGKIKLSDRVRTSEHAASMGGSQIFLEVGEEMTVEEMLKGIAIASANDASVAMAEHIAGTEEAFVKRMNEKAKELGLENTHFVNCNGLPAENHYTTAYDIAIMSRELLKYDLITKYTGIYQDYLRKDTDNPFWLVNTNRLVRFYEGVDGLKTGYTSEAKFCLATTAKRNNMRTIAVVMGEPSSKVRNQEVSRMLDYAFNHYETHPLYKKGEVIQTIPVDKGKEQQVNLVTAQQLSILTKKGENVDQFDKQIKIKDMVPAPVARGDVFGEIVITAEGNVLSKVDLIAENNVEKAGLWDLMKRTTRNMITHNQ
ncbi:MAG: D-alanyl-D-alanine carboxypeptidase [Bacillaceae bacterium]|nr:D-alanyl-D-alanine carboxypeptidase [Bacillaceae bacterium]